MAIELTDIFRAAELIQWGLQPKMRPIQNTAYRELIREYLNRGEFRDIVAEMSDGLGLYVLNVSEHGVVLSPREASVFWLKSSDFRQGNTSADTRLLDGLVQITIAATVFPRARDLEDDINRPRPPVSVNEIEENLRALTQQLAAEFKEVDPLTDDVRSGLYDAWRVYENTMSSRETKDGRKSSATTRRIIEFNLNRLKDFGCFTETKYASKPAWQPTRRYNVLVQELAASRLYDEVMKIKAGANIQEFEEHNDDLADIAWDDDSDEEQMPLYDLSQPEIELETQDELEDDDDQEAFDEVTLDDQDDEFVGDDDDAPTEQ